MRIDFSQTFTTLDGVVIEETRGDGHAPVTLGSFAAQALVAADQTKPETGEEKVRAYDVAVRIYKGGEQEVSAEDIALMKAKVGAFGTALVVGQAYRMLEQK